MIALRKILCPTDFSKNSEHAVEYGLALAEAYNAEVELFHVVSPAMDLVVPIELPPTYGAVPGGSEGDYAQVFSKMAEIAEGQLAQLAERLRAKWPRISHKTARGVAFVEIVKRAREIDADLIVLGTHGRTGIKHALIGSCAERVVRKAPCPVLTVRHPEHEFVTP